MHKHITISGRVDWPYTKLNPGYSSKLTLKRRSAHLSPHFLVCVDLKFDIKSAVLAFLDNSKPLSLSTWQNVKRVTFPQHSNFCSWKRIHKDLEFHHLCLNIQDPSRMMVDPPLSLLVPSTFILDTGQRWWTSGPPFIQLKKVLCKVTQP